MSPDQKQIISDRMKLLSDKNLLVMVVALQDAMAEQAKSARSKNPGVQGDSWAHGLEWGVELFEPLVDEIKRRDKGN